MHILSDRRSFQSSWASWLGIVCIALVLFTGIVQVAHTHPGGQLDHDGCSLCITAHNTVQAVADATLEVTVQRVVQVVPEESSAVPRQRFLLKLAIRPPPAVPVSA